MQKETYTGIASFEVNFRVGEIYIIGIDHKKLVMKWKQR